MIAKLNGAPVERERLDRILGDLAGRRPLRCFLPLAGAALRCHRNLGHLGACSPTADPWRPGAGCLRDRRCGPCGAAVGRVPLRVVFLPGIARVVCDGCLETIQRGAAAWAYCYLPSRRDR